MLTIEREHELDKLFGTIRDYLSDEAFETFGLAMTEFCCEITAEAFISGRDEGVVEGYEDGYAAGFDDGSRDE